MKIENGTMHADWTSGFVELPSGLKVPTRLYGSPNTRRPSPLVLHLHGGAFQAGSFAAGSPIAGLLAEAGAVVLSVDYPCGKGHPFPEALEIAFALLEELGRKRKRWADKHSGLFVAGEEAGGNLAAALALMARDRGGPKLSGQILLSPMLDPSLATCSIRDAEAGAVGCKWADGWHDYLGSPDKAAHPYAAPAAVSRLAGLPPALILTAQDDPMHDESCVYQRRLRENGVLVLCRTIAAPSGWPNAICHLQKHECGWAADVRAALADFFTATSPKQIDSARGVPTQIESQKP